MRKLFLVIVVIQWLGFSVLVADPSLAVPQSVVTDTLVLQPGPEGKDCYICDCSPNTNSPNGGINYLYQGQYQSCFDRLLIQWDISALPHGVTITKAEMQLYCYNRYGDKVSGQMVYYRITSFWNEDSVTFNTQPDTSHDVQVISTPWPAGGRWHSADVTQFVRGWYEGTFPNYGIYGHSIGTTATCVAGFYSSDCGTANFRPKLTIIYTTTTDVKFGHRSQPQTFTLLPNYPNPFNPRTKIRFGIPTTSNVILKIYSSLGQEAATLAEGRKLPGIYEVQWDATGMASGTYFCRLQAYPIDPSGSLSTNGNQGKEFVKTEKLILLR